MIDAPVLAPPSLQPNRTFDGERLGGGGTAVPTEVPRAINDAEQTSLSRRSEAQDNASLRVSPNDAELAAQARFLVARNDQTPLPTPAVLNADDFGIDASQTTSAQAAPPAGASALSQRVGGDDQELITSTQFAELREQLESLLSEGPSGFTLRSVDEFI